MLEIGAGTGGTTTNMLLGLRSEFGERLYSKYSYTDISPGFFVAAKERFKDYGNIEFSVLDISKDPLEQGFEEGSYDSILAANVTIRLQTLAQGLSTMLIMTGTSRYPIVARVSEQCEQITSSKRSTTPSRA